MKYHIISIPAALLLAGCATSPTPEQYDKLADQLAKINQNLEAINKAVENNNRLMQLSTQSTSSRTSTANRGNMLALSKIAKLSEKPTDAEIRKYILAIKAASDGQNHFGPDDIQTKMLREIGPGHLSVIIPFLDNSFYHLDQALPALIEEKDKDFVTKNILRYPRMAVIAFKMGWEKDAKDDIFKVFETDNNQIWELKSNIGKIVETPEDRERVIKVYINGASASDLYNTIQAFPDIDLVKINNDAWEKQKYSHSWSRIQYGIKAASTGNKEALGSLIQLFSTDRNTFNHNEGATTLMRLTGQTLNAAKLTEWYDKNKDNLYFDKEKGRFLVKAAEPAPTVEAPQPAEAK